MVTATRTDIRLHEGQLAILRSKARVTCVPAGQGGGKTLGGYFWLLANMRAFPGESHLVGFPDYGLLQRVIINQPDPERQTLVEFLRGMGEHPHLHIQERRIKADSGQVFFTSGEDLVGWEGAHVKTAWIDEFDLCPLEAYKRALERTRMRQGYVLLTGTPRLVKWVGKELAPLWERGDPFVTRVQFPSTMNPRYRPEAMEEARRLLPAWEFKRLHLGELAAVEGGNVVRREWWRYWRELPLLRDRIFTVDTAFKDKTSDDYSVFACWGSTSTGFYLLDLWRAKVEYPELKRGLEQFCAKHNPGRVLVEDAASGQSLIQDLRRNSRIPILPFKVDRDKYTRICAVTGLIEAGRCHLPESAPWVHDFIEEHAEFPAGEYDDQVDTTSMALGWLTQREGAGKSEMLQTAFGPRLRRDNPLGLNLDDPRYTDKDKP